MVIIDGAKLMYYRSVRAFEERSRALAAPLIDRA
jgi:hypothetical protein